MEKPDIDFNSKAFHLDLIHSIESELPKQVRQRHRNSSIVRDYILGNTSKGGSTSCNRYCIWLGIDPYSFTFFKD
jgi:hypothetical protein